MAGRTTTGTTGVTTTYNTTVPATTVSTTNYGTGYGGAVGHTTSTNNVKFGYGTSGVRAGYTTSAANRDTIISVPVTTGANIVTRPAETYTTTNYVAPVNYTTTQGIYNFIQLWLFLKLLSKKFEELKLLLNLLLFHKCKEFRMLHLLLQFKIKLLRNMIDLIIKD